MMEETASAQASAWSVLCTQFQRMRGLVSSCCLSARGADHCVLAGRPPHVMHARVLALLAGAGVLHICVTISFYLFAFLRSTVLLLY